MQLQQIDLYPEYLRPKPVIFPLRIGLMCTTGLCTVLVALLVLVTFQEYLLNKDRNRLKAELESVVQAMETFKAENQKKELDVLLQAKEKAYQDILDKRQKLLVHLDQGNFGYSGGFSDFFIALGRQHVQGLWLEQIVFKEKGEEVVLRGMTQSPSFIPSYVNRLKSETIFDGLAFTNLSLDRSVDSDQLLAFKLSVNKNNPAGKKSAGFDREESHSAWISAAP